MASTLLTLLKAAAFVVLAAVGLALLLDGEHRRWVMSEEPF